jgi:6-phosphogluconolactonase
MGCSGSSSGGTVEGAPDAWAPGHDAGATDDGAGVDAPAEGSSPAGDGPSGGDDGSPPGRLMAYASGYGPEISIFSVDGQSGALAPSGTVASFGSSPSFLAVNPAATNLYALDEVSPGQVGAYAIGASGALTFIGAVSSGGAGPAFVSVDRSGKFVLVANYDSGTVAVLPVKPGGGLGAPVESPMVGAEAHMIMADPSNRFVFVPCKGADYVAQLAFDAATGKLTPNAVPHVATAAGAGPRHIAFHPKADFAYLINENDSTMTAYAFDPSAGTLTEIETQSTLPPGFSGTNTGAEVWVHPSGGWLFGSNRGDDSIVVFALDAATGRMTRTGFTKTGGATPRDFTLDPTGTFLYAANQDSGTIVPFRFDAAHGSLTPVASPVTVPMASFIGLVRAR